MSVFTTQWKRIDRSAGNTEEAPVGTGNTSGLSEATPVYVDSSGNLQPAKADSILTQAIGFLARPVTAADITAALAGDLRKPHYASVVRSGRAKGFTGLTPVLRVFLDPSNAGGYTHTSVSIADAIAAIAVPVVEVHISQPAARESYRHNSLIASKCKGSVSGFGLRSYEVALRGLCLSLMK